MAWSSPSSSLVTKHCGRMALGSFRYEAELGAGQVTIISELRKWSHMRSLDITPQLLKLTQYHEQP